MSKTPLKINQPYLALQGRRTFQVILSESVLEDNDLGSAILQSSAPMVTAKYSENRFLGSFVLVDPVSKNSLAGGIVV